VSDLIEASNASSHRRRAGRPGWGDKRHRIGVQRGRAVPGRKFASWTGSIKESASLKEPGEPGAEPAAGAGNENAHFESARGITCR